MRTIERKERGNLAVEWVDDGVTQAEDMGGEALLSCVFYLLEGDYWLPLAGCPVATQTRRSEDDDVLATLLDKLLDRLETLPVQDATVNAEGQINISQNQDFFQSLHWFGPEMAEEY